ncbi:TRAP transporter small permease [Pikeienuella piscinae]|uniref:TRAP transporter small permease protein n=1 Tax=Pikeienuella piscinae TaxID=2748098 RepID=A0A7L5BV12_9RHOB|nr:TRAP transporter small permease [Pikeienuella piscinae]QIE54903.1 TRAP transporter small permease [Pikeienuella piscinae]
MTPGLERILRALDALAGSLVGLMLFTMMCLTTADVVSRYLFNRPIGAALELTEALMAITIFAAFPLVAARGRHITVDLTEMMLPKRARLFLDALAQLVCAAMCGFLAWRMIERAVQLHGYGETSAVLGYPVWPTAAVIALGCAVATPMFALRGLMLFRRAAKRGDRSQHAPEGALQYD